MSKEELWLRKQIQALLDWKRKFEKEKRRNPRLSLDLSIEIINDFIEVLKL